MLAPLTSAPAATVAGLDSSDSGLLSDLGWGFFFGVLLGVPASYVGMIVFGVPTYLALRKLRLLRLWIFSTVGAIVPLLMLVESAPLRTTLMAVAAGLAVGASARSFYFPMYRCQGRRRESAVMSKLSLQQNA